MTKIAPPSPFYRVSLKAIVFNSDLRLLVVKNEDGRWELPGGGWEHGESMQHCVRREMMEELGAGVKNIDFSSIYPYAGERPKGGMGLKLAVRVELNNFEFTVGDDIIDYAWVQPSELAKLEMDSSEAGIKTHIDRIWPKP